MEFILSLLGWGISIAAWVMSVFISSCQFDEAQNCSVSADRSLTAIVVLVPQANECLFLFEGCLEEKKPKLYSVQYLEHLLNACMAVSS